MTATSSNIRFTSPAAKKQFEIGMGIVRAKLARAHQPTAEEREAATIKQGRLAVLKKLGSVGYRKCFGCSPPAPAPKPPIRTTATTRKTFTVGPRVLHRYANMNWFK